MEGQETQKVEAPGDLHLDLLALHARMSPMHEPVGPPPLTHQRHGHSHLTAELILIKPQKEEAPAAVTEGPCGEAPTRFRSMGSAFTAWSHIIKGQCSHCLVYDPATVPQVPQPC